jgi:hypothetical protein
MLEKIDERSVTNIAQEMFRVYKMITGIEITGMFNDGHISTGLPENTQGMRLPQGCPGDLFKYLHHHLADILGDPCVEDTA